MNSERHFYCEIEGNTEAEEARKYFKDRNIEYVEQIEDGYYVGSLHIFIFPNITDWQIIFQMKNYLDILHSL